MLYNNIEQELWRIFTFYSLHADTNQPENMRPASFIRFCKDCQIITSKIQPTAVSLEVTRLLRAKGGVEYNASTSTLQFSDFMQLLDTLAQKVYSKEAPDFAVKRLLLENILLLANRRVPTDEIYDLSNAEATKVIKETFGKSLRRVFDYYVDRASKRRNQAITAEKMNQKDLRNNTNHDLTAIVAARQQILQELQENAKSQKDNICYKEYVQFCYDFNLKSTSLLTAIQIGEIFLNIAPFSSDLKFEVGINFDMFCKAILYMAFVAYREVDPRVTAANKARGILLHMWKAVNDNEKTSRLVSNNRANTLTQFAGSLNVFGSGQFSDSFLSIWMKDGFPDYSVYKGDDGLVNGATVIKSVVSEATIFESPKKVTQTQVPDNIFDSADDSSIIESLQRSVTLTPAATASQGRRTNSVYMQHFGAVLAHRSALAVSHPEPSSASNAWRRKGTVQLEGFHLAELFRLRPELSEFVFMEIENAKLSTTNFTNL